MEKSKDGQHWITTCGKNIKLNGIRRVSKCKGSLECTNKKCPCYLCQKGSNKKAFEQFAGEYTCKNCGHIVSRQWYGAKKVVEYDRSTKTMTVWHQGMYPCTLKTRDETKEEKEKKKQVLKIIINILKIRRLKYVGEGGEGRGGGQSRVNLGRICKDFARISSDSVDPGGVD